MAAALPHLTSLNTYYHFNVAYHAISKLWTKSDKAAAVKTLKGHRYVLLKMDTSEAHVCCTENVSVNFIRMKGSVIIKLESERI